MQDVESYCAVLPPLEDDAEDDKNVNSSYVDSPSKTGYLTDLKEKLKTSIDLVSMEANAATQRVKESTAATLHKTREGISVRKEKISKSANSTKRIISDSAASTHEKISQTAASTYENAKATISAGKVSAASTLERTKSRWSAFGTRAASALTFRTTSTPSGEKSGHEETGDAAAATTVQPKLFGAALKDACSRQESCLIPPIIIACANSLLTSGLNTENIFKTPIDEIEQERLTEHFDLGLYPVLPFGTSESNVAALLMRYLRSLPTPLMTYGLYEKVITAGNSIPALIRDHLQTLPAANFAVLRVVIEILHRTAMNAEINKMDAEKLAAAFSPILIWPDPNEKPKPITTEVKETDALKSEDTVDESPIQLTYDQRVSLDLPAIASVIRDLIDSYEALFNPEEYFVPMYGRDSEEERSEHVPQ